MIKASLIGDDEQILEKSNFLNLLTQHKNIEIRDVYSGSVGFWILCETPEAIEYLKEISTNGQLAMALQKDLVAKILLPWQQGLLCSINAKIVVNSLDEQRLNCISQQSMYTHQNSKVALFQIFDGTV